MLVHQLLKQLVAGLGGSLPVDVILETGTQSITHVGLLRVELGDFVPSLKTSKVVCGGREELPPENLALAPVKGHKEGGGGVGQELHPELEA